MSRTSEAVPEAKRSGAKEAGNSGVLDAGNGSRQKGGEKTMSNLGKKIAGGLIVGMMVMGMMILKAGNVWADTQSDVSTTAVVDVLVTPIVTASLLASPTFYDFGLLSLNSSSFSATAITLSNNGNISVGLQKHGGNSANWAIAASSGVNTFRLFAATATTPPTALAEFADNDRMNDDTALTSLDAVGGGANQAIITSTETVAVWFRIDMPSVTSVSAQQTLSVHFVGTAQ